MTPEEKARAYDKALERAKRVLNDNCTEVEKLCLECVFPQLAESEDEKIKEAIEDTIRVYGKTQGEWIGGYDMDTLVIHLREAFDALEKQKDGQYVIDLSLEQEAYIMSEKFKEAEKEKDEFTALRFLQCLKSFDKFREGENYWLGYIGGDTYVGRSDNVLGEKFHITPRRLFTLFSNKLEVVQCPPQEEIQLSPSYESAPMNILKTQFKSPSDEEIIGALLHHLSEQDGILTAIDGVSTKEIMDYLGKQKEQKPAEWSEEDDYFINMLILHFNYLIDKGGDSVETYKSYREQLKSLRPQPHWKPSEEQMDALRESVSFWRGATDKSPRVNLLESLYTDLKKL